MNIPFQNTYTSLPQEFFQRVTPDAAVEPKLLAYNSELGEQLGVEPGNEEQLTRVFSGQEILEGADPIAMAYAGHQFGHFVPQLGDGRACLLGEVLTSQGKRFDIQLKGGGQTPFSRGGDGRSALGPVIREYIVSEAMFHLGVPTTRALAAVTSGENVVREESLPGGIFTRVAASHIRVGTFEFFSSRKMLEHVRKLADYCIERHYPDVKEAENPYLEFFKAVGRAKLKLVAKWKKFGFIHGVMNTDNTSVSGETIDFGPCAFMDHFGFERVFSSIDRRGRYAYANQGPIALWNLTSLATTLVPLIDKDLGKAEEMLNEEIQPLSNFGFECWLKEMRPKLGLFNEERDDRNLIMLWLQALEREERDFTLSFRQLSSLVGDNEQTLGLKEFEEAWRARLKKQPQNSAEVASLMDAHNPVLIPRNHQVEKAIEEAVGGSTTHFLRMVEALKEPFVENEKYADLRIAPQPHERVQQTFCGT